MRQNKLSAVRRRNPTCSAKMCLLLNALLGRNKFQLHVNQLHTAGQERALILSMGLALIILQRMSAQIIKEAGVWRRHLNAGWDAALSATRQLL